MPVKIFFCYAREDEALLKKLQAHLKPLQRQGLIDIWHDRDINAGTEWEQEISKQLNEANIILLLLSPDFMASDYCYGKEMKRAMEKHKQREAQVIPIILRPVYWQDVLGKLQALPRNALPVSDPDWHDIDRAFYNVVEGIHKAVDELSKLPSTKPSVTPTNAPQVKSGNQYNPVLSTPSFAMQDEGLPSSQEVKLSLDDSYPTELKPVTGPSDGKANTIENKNETSNVWRIGKSEIVSIAIGSVLFAVLAKFEPHLQFSGDASRLFPVFPAIVIPLFFGAVLGPWVGLFIGVVGYLMEHYVSGAPFDWVSNLSLAMMGFIAGFAMVRTRGRYQHVNSIFIAEIMSAIGLIVSGACSAFLRILFLKATVEGALNIIISYTLFDLIICLVLLPILLVAYNAVDSLRNVKQG